jgi:hypothetical protein
MIRQSWREWTLLCWTIIQFTAALSLQITSKVQIYKISWNSKLNVKKFHGDWSQIQNQPPDSRLPPIVDSARPYHRRHHSIVCISCYQSRNRQNIILVFPHRTAHSYSQAWRTLATMFGVDACSPQVKTISSRSILILSSCLHKSSKWSLPCRFSD